LNDLAEAASPSAGCGTAEFRDRAWPGQVGGKGHFEEEREERKLDSLSLRLRCAPVSTPIREKPRLGAPGLRQQGIVLAAACTARLCSPCSLRSLRDKRSSQAPDSCVGWGHNEEGTDDSGIKA